MTAEGRGRVSVLDDYQDIARTVTDWTPVLAHADLDVITEHIADEDDLVARLADSDVVVAMRERTPFPAGVLARLPRLRLLVTTGMKNASFDLPAAHEYGITVCGTAGSGVGVAELTIGMMIALARNFAAEDASMRAGGWQHTIGPALGGQRLGVLGLGQQGLKVAALGQALGMSVMAWSPRMTDERAAAAGVDPVSIPELMSGADFVTVQLVLARTTRGLIGADELALMKPTAYLINTARGPIVDELALIDVLTRRAIAGAALDVFDHEPLPTDHPLRDLPNTLLLPHIGYVTTQSYEIFFREVVEDIVAFRAGSPVRVLTPG